MREAALSYSTAFFSGLRPDPILTVSEWADEHRILSSRSSAEPGKYRTSRTPYLREIADHLSVTSPIETVILMKGAQVGGTEIGNNWIGYIIDHVPGPIMSVMPRVDDAKKNSKVRIAPMIEDNPRLRAKVKDARSRDSGNTVQQKDFPGGTLVMTGANSAPGLRSLPARFLLFDEVDAYPEDIDGEGDPISLAKKRSNTFSRRKIFELSTPTIEGVSNIENDFMDTDQRYYFVPCPECKHYQRLIWSQVKWDPDDTYRAWYECEKCERKIENWEKTTMLNKGKWKPTNKNPKKKKAVGYHLSALYSPVGWFSWGDCAQEFVESKGKRAKLKTFINTILGETWKEKGEAPDWKRLWERRCLYEINTIDPQICFLTAGVDVQADRLEVEITGWGRDKRSWSIDYRVLWGDTSAITNEPWLQLTEIVHEIWEKNGLEVPLGMMAVDSGYRTQVVYSWVRQFSMTKVIAVKGRDELSVMIGGATAVDVTVRGKRKRKGLKLFNVGVSLIKSELYGFLRLDGPGPDENDPHGFCRFPQYGEHYFKMLTAEQLQVRIGKKGFKKYEWILLSGRRNEALDCRVYARAAASVLGIDRWKEAHWAKRESEMQVPKIKIQVTGKKDTSQTQKKLEKPVKKVKIKRRKSNYL